MGDQRQALKLTTSSNQFPQSAPRYKDSKDDDLKVASPPNYSHPPWLVRRTSIYVESSPADDVDDALSDQISVSTTNDEKKAVRNLIDRFGRKLLEVHDDQNSVANSKHDSETTVFGTTVSIEASQPKTRISKKREMQGLAEAASLQRWSGTSQPGEAWGKLAKVSDDPCQPDLSKAYPFEGSRALGCDWRHIGIFRVPTFRALLSNPLVAARSHAFGIPDLKAARRPPVHSEIRSHEPASIARGKQHPQSQHRRKPSLGHCIDVIIPISQQREQHSLPNPPSSAR